MPHDRFRLNEHRMRVFGDDDVPIVFLCECSDPNCLDAVPLTPAAYERIRPGAVLAAGHPVGPAGLQLIEHEPTS